MRRTRKSALLALIGSLAFALMPPSASAVNADYLLSDQDLVDASSMSLGQIHSFLMRKGPLAYSYLPDVDGVVRTPAEIINRVAGTYGISPRFLLALIQREQSLIEDPSPSPGQYDWATGFAVCDACSTADPDVLAWKGFAKQVEGAARQIRNRYLPDLETRGMTVSGIGPGIPRTIDGITVVPRNKATAILYTYTPHLQGNINFANIWKRWFSLSYPDGSVVNVLGAKAVWLIQGGERRKFATRSVFLSRVREADVIPIRTEDLERYPEGRPIRFANYSLLHAPDGKIYLTDGDVKRHIVDEEVFRKLGFNPDEVEDVSPEDLDAYAEGAPITLGSAYPQGALIQDAKTGGVSWVQDGIRHPIWSRELLQARFPKKTIIQASADLIASFAPGDPVRFADGNLIGVKGVPTVYVVEHGARRPIANEKAFLEYGWKWSNVVWTTAAVVNQHALGEPLDVAAPVQAATAP